MTQSAGNLKDRSLSLSSVGITLMLAVSPLWAQQGQREPEHPAESVSQAEGQEALEAEEQAEFTKYRQRTEARRKKLEKLVAPFKRRLDAALKRDKQLARRMAEFQAASEAAGKDGISDEEREQRLARLREFDSFETEVLEKMGFDRPGFRRQVKEALALPARGPDEKPPADAGEHIVWGKRTSFLIVPAAEPDPGSQVMPRGLVTTRTLGAPYPEAYIRKRGPGRSNYADPADPGYRAHAQTNYIGYYTNAAGLGHIETVPRQAGGGRMIVDAALPSLDTWGAISTGGEPGWASIKARSLIYVIHNGRIKCRRGYTHWEAWTLFGYIPKYSEGSDSVTLLCAFAAPPPGDKVVVRYRGYATINITSVGWGHANVEANARSTPRDIRISYYD